MSVVSVPDLNHVRRLVIVRLSSIGDVVHAIPISAALGESFPDLEISWIVEEMSAPIVTGNPYLHEVIVIPRSRWKQGRTRSPRVWREYLAFLASLRRRKFEVCLDLQGYAKSGLLTLATCAPYRFGWYRMREGSGIVSLALTNRSDGKHRVDRFLDVARACGAVPRSVKFPIHVPNEAKANARRLLSDHGIADGDRYAVLNAATGDQIRRWGSKPYAETAAGLWERLGLKIVLIGSGKDAPINVQVVERVHALAPDCPIIDLAGRTELKELAAALSGAAVHVGGDTGSTHIAVAMECPVVALFGPTDPAFAGPYGHPESVIEHRRRCLPTCTSRVCAAPMPTDASDFPGGAIGLAACMRSISPAEVVERVEQALHAR